MNDNTIDVEVVPAGIVRCPRCGARNRLVRQDRRVGYRCGGCSTPLENPFARASIIRRCFLGIARRSLPVVGKFVGLLIIAILAVFAVLRNIGQQESSPVPDTRLAHPPQVVTVDSRPSSPPDATTLSLPPLETSTSPPKSLENGTILTDLTYVGHGQFTIQNDTDRDAVVKLINEAAKRSVVSVYVTAHNSATIDEIPEGSFAALCGQGVDWDDVARHFKKKRSFAKFQPDFNFNTEVELADHQIIRRRKIITLELAPSLVGNITKSDISEEAFLEY